MTEAPDYHYQRPTFSGVFHVVSEAISYVFMYISQGLEALAAAVGVLNVEYCLKLEGFHGIGQRLLRSLPRSFLCICEHF